MDKYPVREDGRIVGEMTAQQQGLYTALSVVCPHRPGLWCAWAAGRGEALRIGILEPLDGSLHIRRRFSPAQMGPVGPLTEGQLRPVGQRLETWRPLGPPEQYFQSPLLRRCLGARAGVLTCLTEAGRCVAIPRDDAAPFPIEAMFCFAAHRYLGDGSYWVFTFDSREWPVPEPEPGDGPAGAAGS